MEFHLLFICSLISLLLAASDASLPAEDYWKAVLPNTPFPKALEDVLQQHGNKIGSTFFEDDVMFNVRRNTKYKSRYNKAYNKTVDPVIIEESMKDGVTTNDGKKNESIVFNERRNKKYRSRYNKTYNMTSDPDTIKESMKDGVTTNDVDKKSEDTFLKDGMVFNARRNKKYKSRYNKTYKKTQSPVAAKEFMEGGVVNDDNKEIKSTSSDDNDMVINSWMDENDDLFDTTIFYLYRDIYPSRRMKLLFNNAGSRAGFLPRQMAESIPFSSDSIPKMLELFSLKTESAEAQIIIDTVEECEYPKMKGEEKYCPTSLESLIDFVVTRLGRNIKVLSSQSGSKQEYTVLTRGKMLGDKVVVCHKEIYPYAVYYCHEIDDTKAYMVLLKAPDGTRVKAVTICHEDTSTWSPEHVSFELLKVKPGVPICHFLASDTLVWFQAKDPGQDFITSNLSRPAVYQ